MTNPFYPLKSDVDTVCKMFEKLVANAQKRIDNNEWGGNQYEDLKMDIQMDEMAVKQLKSLDVC